MEEERRNNGIFGQTPGSSNSGRRNRRKGKGKGTGERKTSSTESKFARKYAEMNGNVFQCHPETEKFNQFDKSVEELNRYASTYTNNSRDIQIMLLTQREVNFTEPQDPLVFPNTEKNMREKNGFVHSKERRL